MEIPEFKSNVYEKFKALYGDGFTYVEFFKQMGYSDEDAAEMARIVLCQDHEKEKLFIEIEPTTSEYGMAVKLNGMVLIVKDKESILEEVLSFLGYEVEVVNMAE